MYRDDTDGNADHSLAAQAWRRASRLETPTTMTPWEWQQWYAEHGVPATHRAGNEPRRLWWKRLFGSD